jgi:UDP-N-acetylmuramoyl-L-alanyl-D-glutamate--2,6-diaminopimelate ligase
VCFTNLSHEHLDYFGSMEAYFSAKLKILEWLKPGGKAVAPTSIRAGRLFLRHARRVYVGAPFPVGGYRDKISIADICFCREKMLTEVAFRVWISRKMFKLERVKIKAPGRFNAENLLIAAGALLAMGYTPEEAKYGLDMVSAPPGRMEVAKTPDGKILVIDYAHTPRALRRALEELRWLFPGARVIAVFGAGGDRDREKRPLMGQVADKLANFSILTSDNPRSEDPEKICLEILAGFSDKSKAKVIVDREKAIVEALKASRPGDVILLAGKGHETYQIFGEKKIPFSEKEVVENFYGRKVFQDVEI